MSAPAQPEPRGGAAERRHPGAGPTREPALRPLAAVWAAASAGSALLWPVDPRLGALCAVAGALGLLFLRHAPSLRLATLMALLPAVAAGDNASAFVAAAAFLFLVLLRPPPEPHSGADLQRHLAHCRRRGEPACVLVSTAPTDRAVALRLVAGFRVTDSVAYRRFGDSFELHGVFDAAELDRQMVEQRVCAAVPGAAAFGWARFPDDGATLESLVEHARGAALDKLLERARAAEAEGVQAGRRRRRAGWTHGRGFRRPQPTRETEQETTVEAS